MPTFAESKDPIEIPELPSGSVKDFIPYLSKNPDTPIGELLEPYKAFERELRKVYAQQPDHEIVKDAAVNLVSIFDGHEQEVKTRVRAITPFTLLISVRGLISECIDSLNMLKFVVWLFPRHRDIQDLPTLCEWKY
jgi:hypothetical protein